MGHTVVSFKSELIVKKNTTITNQNTNTKKSIDRLEAICDQLIRRPDFRIAKIFSYKRHDDFSITYDMELLPVDLSAFESTLINLYPVNIINNKSMSDFLYDSGFRTSKHTKKQIRRIKKRANKECPSLLLFINSIKNEYTYQDFHAGNIRKDKHFNYKLIDLEGFIMYPHLIQTYNGINYLK